MIVNPHSLLSRRSWYILLLLFIGFGTFVSQTSKRKWIHPPPQALMKSDWNTKAFYGPTTYSLSAKHSKPSSGGTTSTDTNDNVAKHKFSAELLWSKLQPMLERFSPDAPEIPLLDDVEFSVFDPDASDWTSDLLHLNATTTLALRDAHQGYVRAIQSTFKNHIHDSTALQRGIVMTASTLYLPTLVVSLRMLRFTGTTLPVEVWIGERDEYEADACEMLLRQLNARCRVMEDVFLHKGGTYTPRRKFVKYEYKVFAMLFSTFQEMIFLDADSFPLHPLEELFESDPYTHTGLVLWPDIWREAVSPAYYLVSGGKPRHRGVRAAAESGQVMMNKKLHFCTLLLAGYYNYFGESHYYTLLSQNGPGRGDKDTFGPAAEVLGKSFWQVREPVASVGHSDGSELGSFMLALIQFDPVQDFRRYHRTDSGNKISNIPISSKVESSWSDDHELPRMSFLHCNSRKWNPREVLEFHGEYDLAWNVERKPVKAYTDPPELAERLGPTERVIWDQVRWVACESGIDFKDWEGTGDEICDKVSRYYFTFVDPQSGWEPYIPPPNESFPSWPHDPEDQEIQNEEESREVDEGHHEYKKHDGRSMPQRLDDEMLADKGV